MGVDLINDDEGNYGQRWTRQRGWIAFNCGARGHRIFGRRRAFERPSWFGVFAAPEENLGKERVKSHLHNQI
jgi:hypothetical protein